MYRENGGEYEDAGEKGNAVVAESQQRRVERGVLSRPCVDRVDEHQSPAGTGVPGILCQRLQPELRVREIGPVDGEEEIEADMRVRQCHGPKDQDDEHEYECRKQDARDALDAADSMIDQCGRGRHHDEVRHYRLPAPRETSPERPRDGVGDFSGEGRDEEALAPAGDDRVIEHDGRCRERHPESHPTEAAADEPAESIHRSRAHGLAHGEFYHQQRDRPRKQKDQPWNEKRATFIGGHDAGKAPDVSGADGHAEHRQHHAPS